MRGNGWSGGQVDAFVEEREGDNGVASLGVLPSRCEERNGSGNTWRAAPTVVAERCARMAQSGVH